MTQARKPAGSAGGTGGQFDHDPKAGTGDLPALADLMGTAGPDLSHRRLDGRDMARAHLTGADLTGAKRTALTSWPADFSPEEVA